MLMRNAQAMTFAESDLDMPLPAGPLCWEPFCVFPISTEPFSGMEGVSDPCVLAPCIDGSAYPTPCSAQAIINFLAYA